MPNLVNELPAYSFGDLLKTTNAYQGLDSTLRPIQDGFGNQSSIQISTNDVNFNTSPGFTFQLNGIPLTVSATILNNLSTATLNIQPTANQIQTITVDANTKRIALTDNISVVNSITVRDVQISVLESNVISTNADGIPLVLAPPGLTPVRIGQDGSPINLEIRSDSELRLFSSDNATYSGWKCPATGPSISLQMPSNSGNTGDVLTKGSGTSTTWAKTDAGFIEDNYNVTSHGFSEGDVIGMNGSSFHLAQADNVPDAEVIGFVSLVIDANNFKLFIIGAFSGFFGLLTPGGTYFLDPVDAGTVTDIQPRASGQVIKPLFIATSTTNGIWLNQRGNKIP